MYYIYALGPIHQVNIIFILQAPYINNLDGAVNISESVTTGEVFNLDMSDPDNDVFTWEIRDVEPNTNIFYQDGLYLMNLYMADQITFI